MQQTADAVANVTKDQMVVDSEIILVSGLSYSFSSVVVTDAVLHAVDLDVAMTAVSGLSYFSSAAAATVGDLDVATAVDVMTATMVATNLKDY